MGHLGVDVAAFVDGQLSAESMQAARAHLEECDDCRKAVRQQEALKARMGSVATPTLSPQFLASLSCLPQARISHESLWARVCRSRTARFGAGILGASITVVVVAYGIGGIREQIGDTVTPASDRYAADFLATRTMRASTTLTPGAMNELNEAGWPCRHTLAGDMHRIGAEWLDGGRTVSLTYASTTYKLRLFEQNGALDPDGLRGFQQRTINHASVWVRDGLPTVVVWDADGVVYTLVTNAGRQHIASALGELPTRAPDGGPVQRIGNGFDRMTTWMLPAA